MKFSKKRLRPVAILLARDKLHGLVRNLTSNAINKFERKISGIEIIKSSEDLGVLIHEVTETVKHKIKQGGGFLLVMLAPLGALLVQPVISSVVKDKSRRGVTRAGIGYMDKNF